MGIDSFYGTDQPPERPQALDFPAEPLAADRISELELPDRVDVNKVHRALKKHALGSAARFLQERETRRSIRWAKPAFGASEPATTFSFTFPDNEQNQKAMASGIDYGTYSAVFLPVTAEEQAKTGEASLAARERIRNSPDFKRWLRYAESQRTFLLGTLPPAPETENQMVAFFLHPDQKHEFSHPHEEITDFYDGRYFDYSEEPPEVPPELPEPPSPDGR